MSGINTVAVAEQNDAVGIARGGDAVILNGDSALALRTRMP